MSDIIKVKYRIWGKGLKPQKIKLEIPGWAGDHHLHEAGVTPQPWHCVPFVEGSTYGLELIYPFDAETHVINDNGNIRFEHNFTDKECTWSDPPTPPFSNFAPSHYGFTSSLDISVPEEYIVRIEPHPRFFTDTSGFCPIAVPGHIQSWWCRIFFIVFKVPAIGQRHIFKKDDPYAQMLIVPKKISYDIEPMSETEAQKRQETETNITDMGSEIAKLKWKDHVGNQFDDKYKQLGAIFNKYGTEGIDDAFSKIKNKKVKKGKRLGKLITNDKISKKNKKTGEESPIPPLE